MKTRLLLGLIVILLLVTACSSAEPTSTQVSATQAAEGATTLDGKALVEQRCVGCHNLNRIKIAKKTAEEWKATVIEMVGHGAELTEQEQQIVIDYLAATYPK